MIDEISASAAHALEGLRNGPMLMIGGFGTAGIPVCCGGKAELELVPHTGRNDDMLSIWGVNVYPSQIEAVLVGRPNLAPHYQLVVERRGSRDHVSIEVQAAPGAGADQFEAIARDVAHHIKSIVGITTDVSVLPPGAVPCSQGKAVRVRDLRPKEV